MALIYRVEIAMPFSTARNDVVELNLDSTLRSLNYRICNLRNIVTDLINKT
jgi:hypothetical protein